MSDDRDETRSDLPPFEEQGVVFECWVSGTGGASRYVWRSRDKRLAVGSITAERMEEIDGQMVPRKCQIWWARCDGRLLGREYANSRDAMFYAVGALRQTGEVAA